MPKEKKPKKEKPPKPKKEKKVKEKKVKEKKVKEPKPKKEKKAKDASEGGKKGGKLPLPLLIALPVLLLAAGAAFFFLRIRPAQQARAVQEQLTAEELTELTREDEAEVPDDNPADSSPDAAADNPDGTSPDGDNPDAVTGDNPDAAPVQTQPAAVSMNATMTTGEAVAYINSLSPGVLGLPGESMEEYDVYASEHVVPVDGQICTEFKVYSDAGRAGTNDIEGEYLLTRSGTRHLYRLDAVNRTVTEIPLSTVTPETTPELAEAIAQIEAAEAESETAETVAG